MIHAYDNQYLDDAMKCLGEAMDYAANSCGMNMDTFLELFIGTGYAEQFAAGVPKYVSGVSGTELVMDVLIRSGSDMDFPPVQVDYDYPPQYWCGWILAYYQWYTERSFKEIQKHISMEEIERLYPTLHEASKEKFVDTVNRMIRKKNLPTRLQTQRKISGYSQRELAEKAGVNLRTLQQYEIRAKDINKAAGITLLSLAKALGCRIEDLLEYDSGEIKEEDEKGS
ncbi:MAG: helix-turn-helix transcriptional regulator [Lachnospiraceae bacterium]|nr:helix-turn-helix transcriptional regulator [Lachnospiraceae bacterium]